MIKQQSPPIDENILPFTFPAMQEYRLQNGLNMIVIERPELPEVFFRMGIDFGEKHDPPESPGAVELMSHLLKKGTRTRTYHDFVEQIDFLGGFLDSSSSDDFFYVIGKFLKEHLSIGLELMSDMLLNAAFPEEEVEKERRKMIAELQNEQSSPGYLAHRQMDRALYSPHPYATFKTAESINRITREQLFRLYQRFLSPERSYLVIAGDVTGQEALEAVEGYLTNWKPQRQPPETFPIPEPVSSRAVYLIDRPASEQVAVLCGTQLFPRAHPDYIPAKVANHILGGGSSGRLFLNLREDKGYTYGAYSSLDLFKESGGWICSAEVRPEVVDKSIELIFEEIQRLADEPVSEAELKAAQRYMIGVFPLKNETPASMASLSLSLKLYNLPGNYWNDYLRAIGNVTAEDVQRVARQYLRMEQCVITVVGDARQLKSQLRPFGELQVFDVNGERLE